MKIAIVGSRSITDKELVWSFMEECHQFNPELDKIVSGGARGVDSFAEEYAKIHKIRTCIFKPDWEKYGKSAGFIRNADIIGKCDICICIWDGTSHGAKHDITLCEEMGKPCYIYNLKTNEKIFPE